MTALHKSETSFFMLGLFKETGNLFSPVERPVFTPEEQASQFTGLNLSYRVNCKKIVYDRQILISTQIQKGENVLHGTCKISSKWKLCVLVLARTELIFAVARRGHGQDPEVILCHLTSFSRVGGRGPYQVLQNGGTVSVVRGENLRANHSFLVCSFIPGVATTVGFLISWLFPVNCSHLNLWLLPFVPPVVLSIPMQGQREGRVWVGAPNWGASFLNHDTLLWQAVPQLSIAQ